MQSGARTRALRLKRVFSLTPQRALKLRRVLSLLARSSQQRNIARMVVRVQRCCRTTGFTNSIFDQSFQRFLFVGSVREVGKPASDDQVRQRRDHSWGWPFLVNDAAPVDTKRLSRDNNETEQPGLSQITTVNRQQWQRHVASETAMWCVRPSAGHAVGTLALLRQGFDLYVSMFSWRRRQRAIHSRSQVF